MKFVILALLAVTSFRALATESDTPCPAMNEETREKIIDVKVKSKPISNSTTRQ